MATQIKTKKNTKKSSITSKQTLNYTDIYYKSDNETVHGIYFGKKSFSNAGVIIYARGGNNHPIHEHSMNFNKNDFYKTWIYYLVKNHNFIVLGCDYRGSKGSTGQDDIAGNDVNDIINLYKYAIDTYGSKINKNKIFLAGESMGVFKSLVVASQVNYFAGLILCSGVYNLSNMRKFRPYLYQHWQEDYKLSNKDLLERDNKINISKIKKNVKKIVILHGNDDIKASIGDMQTFITSLIANKFTNFDCHILHNGNHSLSGFEYQIYTNIISYLLN